MNTDQHLEKVARVYEARAASRERYDRELRRALRAAHDAGLSFAQIAAVLDVDRSYVWQLCQD